MDETLENIEKDLQILNQKFPNITNMWKEYLYIRIENLKKDLLHCNNTLQKLKNNNYDDLPLDSIKLLYILSNTI
jgi:hypothetical protein